MMRKRILGVAAMILAAALPGLALAYSVQTESNVTLAKGETKTGTYYAAGQTVTIDGDVDGDLICAGSSVAVNGAVHGDVICAGSSVTVNGPVSGSVRLAGAAVTVNGTVGRNATVAAQNFTVGPAAHISGDLGAVAQTASVNGAIDKDIYGGMQTLSLGASVGPVDVKLQNLALGTNASVHGDLKYMSDNTFTLDKSKVNGQISRTAPPVSHAQREAAATNAGFALRLFWIFAATLAGLVLAALAPRLVRRVTKEMWTRPGASIGWGAIVTLLGPIAFILTAITLIGAPLGALALVVWLLMLLTSGLFAGVAIGQWLLKRADWHKDSLVLAALFGVPLVVIASNLPLVGALVSIGSALWAVGAMSLATKSLRS